MPMPTNTVAVLGGYGVFGSRIVCSLARHGALEVLIAGRNPRTAGALAKSIGGRNLRGLELNITNVAHVNAMFALRPAVVIDAVGPFQGRNHALARRCADAAVHYIDIADNRTHVSGIASLDTLARSNGVAIVSGASTVPAISTAIVDDLVGTAEDVLEIDVGISPGHRAPRGLATARAILSYCGQSIPGVCGLGVEYGWGNLTRHHYPEPVGKRLLSNVDTPERALWRDRYPSLTRASIRAGLELGVLHLGLSLLSRGVRAGLLPSLSRFAQPMLSVANALDRWGNDSGAMHVRVASRAATGRATARTATLVATKGDGPQIPAAPAALIAKKLLGVDGYAPLKIHGAQPCVGLISRAEILGELAGFAIDYRVENH
jgi:Saccharopine dehydrogenase NADP binding domain